MVTTQYSFSMQNSARGSQTKIGLWLSGDLSEGQNLCLSGNIENGASAVSCDPSSSVSLELSIENSQIKQQQKPSIIIKVPPRFRKVADFCHGEEIKLKIWFQSSLPPSIIWKRHKNKITSCSRYQLSLQNNSATLNIPKCRTDDSGKYVVSVKSGNVIKYASFWLCVI